MPDSVLYHSIVNLPFSVNIPLFVHIPLSVNIPLFVYISYCVHKPFSVRIPFHGDYIGLRRNPGWKDVILKNHLHKMDRYVVFADIVNKINRSNGKVRQRF